MLLRSVFLIAIVFAAGCSLPIADDPVTDNLNHATPVPLPEDDPPSAEIGINETELTDPAVLAEAHYSMSNPSYVRNELLCRIARRHRLNRVICVESEETDCFDIRIPSLHP